MPRGRATEPTALDRFREQRADDDFGAFVDRLLRAGLRALRRAAVVLHQQLDVRILEFGERHIGGVFHRLRGDAGIALRRQRQDQADADLARAERGAGRLLAAIARGGVLLKNSELLPAQAVSTAAAAATPSAAHSRRRPRDSRSPSTAPLPHHGRSLTRQLLLPVLPIIGDFVLEKLRP